MLLLDLGETDRSMIFYRELVLTISIGNHIIIIIDYHY